MRVLGFMSGTSLDAIDMAILETDGEAIHAFGPAGECKLSVETRAVIQAATDQARVWPRGEPEPAVFADAARAVAEAHLAAAREFLSEHGFRPDQIDLVGFHGQTVLHERPTAEQIGRTVQLGEAAILARGLGVPVAHGFRQDDVAAGGEGAPLAPIYHAALARYARLPAPVAVLNLGGVANITLMGEGELFHGFDTGPANGMIDLLVQARGLGRYDEGGRLALSGQVAAEVLEGLLTHPYFDAPPPKSLDRYDFPMSSVEGLSDADAATTLVAFTAQAVARGLDWFDEQHRPKTVIAAGGGRHNPAIMQALAGALPARVISAEDAGWRGDSIEAEAFAYLAARTAHGLPISFPGTTGVKAPMTGGKIVRP
jgi:anhydro-N-acetylmuramic acid kinase